MCDWGLLGWNWDRQGRMVLVGDGQMDRGNHADQSRDCSALIPIDANPRV